MTKLSEGPVSAPARMSVYVALLVAGAFFMENLDGTVIATALPQMALSFRMSPVDLNMGMTAYLLTLAVFIPVSGWVADRLGARLRPLAYSRLHPFCAVSAMVFGSSRRHEFSSALAAL
jgi:MFS family permease